MPNPSGKNSPSSFDNFAPTTPYGAKEEAAALQKSAPLAGGGGAHALGTARRATEVALKSAQEQMDARAQAQSQNQGEPDIPPQNSPPVVNDYNSIWSEIAATPGASALVREYASSS